MLTCTKGNAREFMYTYDAALSCWFISRSIIVHLAASRGIFQSFYPRFLHWRCPLDGCNLVTSLPWMGSDHSICLDRDQSRLEDLQLPNALTALFFSLFTLEKLTGAGLIRQDMANTGSSEPKLEFREQQITCSSKTSPDKAQSGRLNFYTVPGLVSLLCGFPQE